MNNAELIGLAKNRFIDNDVQVKLAEHPYLRGRHYLSQNPSLCTEARDVLLNGKSMVVKWNMIESGNLNDKPKTIREVWAAGKHRFREPWRITYTFITGCRGNPPNTPSDILEEIYHRFAPKMNEHGDWVGNGYYTNRVPLSILEHPNCPESIAVIASASNRERLKQAGFAALVRFKRSQKRAKTA
jgi:hypothetical protein